MIMIPKDLETDVLKLFNKHRLVLDDLIKANLCNYIIDTFSDFRNKQQVVKKYF